MKNNLRFGLQQVNNTAPGWIINTTAFVALLLVAKKYLVTDLPGISDVGRHLLSEWFDYILNVIQLILALAVIFTGEAPKNTKG